MRPYISKLKADNGTAIPKKIVEDVLMFEGDCLLNGVSFQCRNTEIEHIDRLLNLVKTYLEMLNVLLQSYSQYIKDFFMYFSSSLILIPVLEHTQSF